MESAIFFRRRSTPWTWFAPEGLSETWEQVLSDAGGERSEDPNHWAVWLPSRGRGLDRQLATLKAPDSDAVVAALPGADALGNKRRLWARLAMSVGKTAAATITPEVFLPDVARDLDALSQAVDSDSLWVVKDSRRQRREGVSMVDDPLAALPDDPAERPSFLVQRRVPDVYAVDGHRCSLRVWVVLRRVGHRLTAFRHQDGLVVYAPKAEDWITRTTDDWLSPPGAPRRLSGLLGTLPGRGRSVERSIDAAIRAACAGVLRDLAGAEGPTDNPCFELFGVDFVLDEALHPWLLEFNRKPRSTPREADEEALRVEVLHDALARGGVPAFGKGRAYREVASWSLPDPQ